MMHPRQRGRGAQAVSAVGYGAMVLEGHCGPAEENDALAGIRRALDAGCGFIDPAAVAKISDLAAPGLAKGNPLVD
jgi:aryl-alcohol dehydrogenase-like predicted oxidoreductase